MKLEIDRRRVRERIGLLEKELKTLGELTDALADAASPARAS